VDNNYLDLGMNKSGFVHTLPSGRLIYMEHYKFIMEHTRISHLVCTARHFFSKPYATQRYREKAL
jgi:hypothetical protein